MHNTERLPQFQAYLKAIRKRKDAKSRVKDAKEAFGHGIKAKRSKSGDQF